MTEAEWLVCKNPHHMLHWLRRLAPSRCCRRWRDFNFACCLRVWNHLADERLLVAALAFDGYASGGSFHEWTMHRATVQAVCREWCHAAEMSSLQEWRGMAEKRQILELHQKVHAARAIAGLDARSGMTATECRLVVRWSVIRPERSRIPIEMTPLKLDMQERRAQCNILRDVMGNPFRNVTLASSTYPSVIASIAQAAYDERDLPSGHLDVARLAVLSDALEEAGCTNADILTHLRSPGPHVRGCWALDLVLGKS